MRNNISIYDATMKFTAAHMAVDAGKYILLDFANYFAECDNLDDAYCILEQIEGEEIENKTRD